MLIKTAKATQSVQDFVKKVKEAWEKEGLYISKDDGTVARATKRF